MSCVRGAARSPLVDGREYGDDVPDPAERPYCDDDPAPCDRAYGDAFCGAPFERPFCGALLRPPDDCALEPEYARVPAPPSRGEPVVLRDPYDEPGALRCDSYPRVDAPLNVDPPRTALLRATAVP